MEAGSYYMTTLYVLYVAFGMWHSLHGEVLD